MGGPRLLLVLLSAVLWVRAADWSEDCGGSGPCPSVGPDEVACPPDSVAADNGSCSCLKERCVRPSCKYGARRELRRHGSDLPGDCCDVYECVPAQEKNCSGVSCPEEKLECPRDSYRLPSHRAPGDCCSVPQGCQCLPAPCPIASCGPGFSARVVRLGNGRPGTCCPLFECVPQGADVGCLLEGGLTAVNGTSWWKDECTRCTCDDGRTLCAVTHCPDNVASCTELHKHPKECCPVCVKGLSGESDALGPDGCVSSHGKILKNGDSWQEDPCTSCVCMDGVKKCQAYMCEVSCGNPTYVPDECCPLCNSTSVVVVPPHCPALHNCSLRCLQGFARDAAGCFLCQCEAEECLLDCPRGYERDSLGNKLCQCAACPPLLACHKNCSHGFRLDRDGCPTCRCSQCRQLSGCSKSCVHGLRTNDRGCPICKCHESAKASGDTLPATHITGMSCASSVGRAHDEGETWFDGCRECYCHGGVEMCNLITCLAPNCSDPIFDSARDCCPHCEGEGPVVTPRHMAMVCQSVDGAYRVEGESWQLDACTRCLCRAGRVLCETRSCPPAPCDYPLATSDCCPRCPAHQGPSRMGRSCGEGRPDGATWWDGACRSCVCVGGHAQCYNQACPPVSCARPVLLKNHCCPMCLDGGAPQVCEVGNMTYQAGEKWSEDPCLHCMCVKGVHSCEPMVCPASCQGPCCFMCPGVDNTGMPVPHNSSGPLVYIAVISLLCCIIACLVFYIWCSCRRRSHRLQLGGTCSNPAYNGFPHHHDHPPPPHYDADRRCRYKYVPTYDSPQIIRSPSIRSTEKSALAPI